MAQAITNTVKQTSSGIFPAPKPQGTGNSFLSGYGTNNSFLSGVIGNKATATAQAPNMSTNTGPKYAPPPVSGAVQSTPVKTAATVNQPATQPTLATAQPTASTYAPGSVQNSGYYQASGTNTQAPAPVRGLFPDVLSSLAYSSGAKNDALAANASKIANDAGQKIADIGGQGARFQAGQLTTGTSPVAEGNAAITAQTTAAQQAAVAAGAQVALTGNAQGITAQGQTQSALNSAAGLAQPSVESYGQTSFDPTTNSFSGGGSLPPEVMDQYASMAANGQYAAIPSFITSNPVLNAQLNVAAKTKNPSYTPIGAQGASSVLAGVPALKSANTAADGIKNSINSYLQANPQLNPSDLATGNLLQQWVQGKQLTDPKYQILFNYLNEYTNTLAPILGVGGDPTNLKTQIAAGFVNAAAKGQSISQVLDAMSQLSTNKIQDIQNGALGNGTSVPNTNSSTGAGGFSEAW